MTTPQIPRNVQEIVDTTDKEEGVQIESCISARNLHIRAMSIHLDDKSFPVVFDFDSMIGTVVYGAAWISFHSVSFSTNVGEEIQVSVE